MTGTVNTLVSDHPWCRTKWSLMLRGGHLREKNKKLSSNRSDLNVITQNYYLTSKNSGKQTTANNVSNRMALRTVENLYITSFINDSIQFYLWIVLQPFLLVNCYNLRAHLVSAFWNWTFVIFEQWFSYSRTWSCRVIAYEKPVRCDKVGCTRFSKKKVTLFLPNERPFKSNCTVRVGVILNNQTGLALTIHFHLPNTESGLHVNSLVCLWH